MPRPDESKWRADLGRDEAVMSRVAVEHGPVCNGIERDERRGPENRETQVHSGPDCFAKDSVVQPER